jgi:hypothetical protein
MKERIFVDTNILIYAHDLEAGAKHGVAVPLIEGLWEKEAGVLSTQVLQEFYVHVTRKILNPLPPAKARSIIENYLAWQVEINGPLTPGPVNKVPETKCCRLLQKKSGTDIIYCIKKRGLRRDKNAGTKPNNF